MKITHISHHLLHVSSKTNWSFVRVVLDGAVTGWGSAVGDAAPVFEAGKFLQPAAAGIGAVVSEAVLGAHPYAPVSGGLDPSLG